MKRIGRFKLPNLIGEILWNIAIGIFLFDVGLWLTFIVTGAL